MKLKHAAVVALVGMLCMQAAYGDAVWVGGGPTTDWSDVNNWSGGAMPAMYENVTVSWGSAINLQDTVYSQTIGNLTLSTTGSLSIGGAVQLTLSDIAVQPGDGGSYTYTINAPIAWNNASNTLNVAGGSTLTFQQLLPRNALTSDPSANGPAIVKTGTGDLTFPGGYSGGGLTVSEGQVAVTSSRLWVFGGLNLASGSTVTSSVGLNLNKQGASGDSLIAGQVTLTGGALNMNGPGVTTIGGANGNITFIGNVEQYDGQIVIDKSQMSEAACTSNALVGSAARNYHRINNIKLIGNDTYDTLEQYNDFAGTYRPYSRVYVQHGLNASATMKWGANNSGGVATAGNGAMASFDGLDLNGSGTYKSEIVIRSFPEVGPTDAKICPWARVGPGDNAFAYSNANNLIMAYTGAGNNQHLGINDPITGANTNVLVSSTTTLEAALTINSLKVDGASALDLGGYTLDVGPALSGAAGVNSGAGIIWTGQAGSISNGTIRAGQAGSGGTIFLSNDVDLIVASDVTLSSTRLSKIGTGSLTVRGSVAPDNSAQPTRINWGNGDLIWENNGDVEVSGQLFDGTTANLVKDGNGTMTIGKLYNQSSGGVIIKSGTVILNSSYDSQSGPNNSLGNGPTLIQSGATLYDYSGGLRTTITMEDGAWLQMRNNYTSQMTETCVINIPTGTAVIDLDGATRNLRGLAGSGTLVQPSVGATFTLTDQTAASSFTGNISIPDGNLNHQGTTERFPAGMNKLIMGANSVLTIGTNVTLTGHSFAISGMVSADETVVTSVGGTWLPGDAGSVGSTSIVGDLALAYNSTASTYARLGIDAPSASSFDRLLVSGTTGYGNVTGLANAILDVAVTQTTPGSGGTWALYDSAVLEIVTSANDLTGQAFSAVNWNDNMRGLVSYGVGSSTGGAITLSNIHDITQAGDGNGDGSVDATDYAMWFNNYGAGAGAWQPGDFNGDGSVDASDYADWFNNYGVGSSGGPVPEPATMTLLVLGGLAILRRRK